jgi:hypothetical protein
MSSFYAGIAKKEGRSLTSEERIAGAKARAWLEQRVPPYNTPN